MNTPLRERRGRAVIGLNKYRPDESIYAIYIQLLAGLLPLGLASI